MGQGASSAGQQSELRTNGSTKRDAKHRRSTRSLPDAALIRTTPASYHNGRLLAPQDPNAPPSINQSSSFAHQPSSRRVGVSTSTSVESGQNIPVTTSHPAASCGQIFKEQSWRDQDSMMNKYMHRDAAPYYVSTKAKPVVDANFNRPWGAGSRKYKKSAEKTRYDDALASSNWSDVASDMFRISKHHRNADSAVADRSTSDVQSDFVPPVGSDRSVHRHNRGSSRRCQQMKVYRSEKQCPEEDARYNSRQTRREGAESDSEAVNCRLTYRDISGLAMTPVPENPYKEQGMDKEKEHAWDNGMGVSKRSKSVHDCASSRRGQMQPPSHPPPRPPKGRGHYYARLENADGAVASSCVQKRGGLVEQWIDFPKPHYGAGVETSLEVSACADTPTPRSPGSSECDKLVIQSLRAELSAERSLRADAERRCIAYDKDSEINRQRIRQLEFDVQKLTEAMEECKGEREEELTASRKKIEELTEKCEQLTGDFRRSVEEKRQMQIRCNQEKSSYDEYMDNVANQVGQALARQTTLKTECARLQKRLLEVEWENKVLKAQLRLTPVWANSNGLRSTNCLPSVQTTPFMPPAAMAAAGKAESAIYGQQTFSDHQNNNSAHTGIVYRRKSFREKMAGLHKYRQSMGSDPTLEHSGAGNTEAPAFSIESLASFNDENDDCYDGAGRSFPLDSSGRQMYSQAPSFPLLNAGEGLCSRPASLNFGTGDSELRRPNGTDTSLGVRNNLSTGVTSQLPTGNFNFNCAYNFDPNENDDDDEEPVKNYTAMFGEGFVPGPTVPLLGAVSLRSSSRITPSFNSAARNTRKGSNDRSVANSIEKNEHSDSSTETLNAGNNSLENANLYSDSSPKRKLDVIVNMLTMDIRQPFSPSIWRDKNKGKDTKLPTAMGYSMAGLLGDDGYSTMSSEFYALFDRQRGSNALFGGAAAEKPDVTSPVTNCKIGRSVSDSRLNDQQKREQYAEERNGRCFSLDGLECDDDTVCKATNEEGPEADACGADKSNHEAMCDIDFCVPSKLERMLIGRGQSFYSGSLTGPFHVPATDQRPLEPSTASTNVNDAEVPNDHQQDRCSGRRKTSRASVKRLSSSSDSSSTECGDFGSTAVGASRSSCYAAVANASTSSTSVTSEDEENGRVRFDEGARTTMQLWMKQLKIKRAGQKSGLVRYLPPDCRPSILRPGVFSRFGTEERRALAYFDFLLHAETESTPMTKGRSRSITDLYENLPYHERTGAAKGDSRCGSRGSLWGCNSISTLNSFVLGDHGLGKIRSYSSSLFLSDFCNDDSSDSSSTSNSSLSFSCQ